MSYNVVSKKEYGTKGSPYMMTKISDKLYKNGSYEDTFVASYEADHEITTTEADELLATKYNRFPITGAAYTMSDSHLVITYTVDHCN